MWIARLVNEVMGVEIEAVKIMVDNQSDIMLRRTLAHHNKTKHIDTCYHFIQDYVEDGRIGIEHVKTKHQLAKILTKFLGRVKFLELCARNGVKKACDENKIKEERDGCNFPSLCKAGAHGTAMARKGEHPTWAYGAHSTAIVAPTEMVPSGARGHTKAKAIVCMWRASQQVLQHPQSRRLVAPSDTWGRALVHARGKTLGGYHSTCQVGACVVRKECISREPRPHMRTHLDGYCRTRGDVLHVNNMVCKNCQFSHAIARTHRDSGTHFSEYHVF